MKSAREWAADGMRALVEADQSDGTVEENRPFSGIASAFRCHLFRLMPTQSSLADIGHSLSRLIHLI